LILLDDLQWVDTGSANLLFHLARRLTGSRILILAAYRPSDVNLSQSLPGVAAQPGHIRLPILHELKRHFGDIEIDLSRRVRFCPGSANLSGELYFATPRAAGGIRQRPGAPSATAGLVPAAHHAGPHTRAGFSVQSHHQPAF
jgi:hypothetical protein